MSGRRRFVSSLRSSLNDREFRSLCTEKGRAR